MNKMSIHMNSFAEMAEKRFAEDEKRFAESEKRRKMKYKDNVELRRHTVQSMLIRGKLNGK